MMTEILYDDELASLKEMMTANSVKEYALTQLLIEKVHITEDEFHGKLKQIQMEYESKGEG